MNGGTTEPAAAARARGVEWLRYWSARHVSGHCGAVFEPTCLSAPQLSEQQTWHCKVTPKTAFMRHDTETISLEFPLSTGSGANALTNL